MSNKSLRKNCARKCTRAWCRTCVLFFSRAPSDGRGTTASACQVKFDTRLLEEANTPPTYVSPGQCTKHNDEQIKAEILIVDFDFDCCRKGNDCDWCGGGSGGVSQGIVCLRRRHGRVTRFLCMRQAMSMFILRGRQVLIDRRSFD